MKYTSKLILFSFLMMAIVVSSCKKQASQTAIVFQNYTWTPVQITVGTATTTIPVGGNLQYKGYPGNSLSGSAYTAGAAGAQIQWTLNETFPSDGVESIPINVSSDYFFLIVQNNSSETVNTLIINYGLTDQRTESVTLQPGNTYDIGYYAAYSNTALQAISSSYTWNTTNLNFDFTTQNLSFTFPLH